MALPSELTIFQLIGLAYPKAKNQEAAVKMFCDECNVGRSTVWDWHKRTGGPPILPIRYLTLKILYQDSLKY